MDSPGKKSNFQLQQGSVHSMDILETTVKAFEHVHYALWLRDDDSNFFQR